MKKYLIIIATLIFMANYKISFAQDYKLKKNVTEHELVLIKKTVKQIIEKDQKYRKYISAETLDDKILNDIDNAFDSLGIAEGYAYKKKLNLKLDKAVKDSLWEKQHLLDFQNHITVRGLIETYGYLSEEVIGKDDYIQFIVLVHPPVDWNVEEYRNSYSQFLKDEVFSGRMTPKFYAQFYDNMNCKILQKPQLYGTTKVFDLKTNSELPPFITNINETNEARIEIGLEPLTQGEYRTEK